MIESCPCSCFDPVDPETKRSRHEGEQLCFNCGHERKAHEQAHCRLADACYCAAFEEPVFKEGELTENDDETVEGLKAWSPEADDDESVFAGIDRSTAKPVSAHHHGVSVDLTIESMRDAIEKCRELRPPAPIIYPPCSFCGHSADVHSGVVDTCCEPDCVCNAFRFPGVSYDDKTEDID